MISKDEISSLSILIPGIISFVRFQKINRIYQYFIFCLLISSANEILSCILIDTGHYTIVNNNVYVLAEAMLYILFFKNLSNQKATLKPYVTLIAVLVITWIWENILLHNIMHVSSWFRIIYSLVIVLLSITFINKLLILHIGRRFENQRDILKNPVFLICIGSVIFFTFKVFVEIFWLYGLNEGKVFRNKVYDILVYVNFIVNLIYAVAVLWMPTKNQYTALL